MADELPTVIVSFFFFFQAEDGIRDDLVTRVQTCALPISAIPTYVNDVIFSGEFTADGAIPTGNISGIEDIGAPSGPSLGVPANATYSISISSTYVNGKGWWYVNGSRAGLIYVISPSKFVVLSWDPSSYQSLLIFEQ